jgi:hypothetical protein
MEGVNNYVLTNLELTYANVTKDITWLSREKNALISTNAATTMETVITSVRTFQDQDFAHVGTDINLLVMKLVQTLMSAQ